MHETDSHLELKAAESVPVFVRVVVVVVVIVSTNKGGGVGGVYCVNTIQSQLDYCTLS